MDLSYSSLFTFNRQVQTCCTSYSFCYVYAKTVHVPRNGFRPWNRKHTLRSTGFYRFYRGLQALCLVDISIKHVLQFRCRHTTIQALGLKPRTCLYVKLKFLVFFGLQRFSPPHTRDPHPFGLSKVSAYNYYSVWW